MKQSKVREIFSTISIASMVIIIVFGVIYFAFLSTHNVYARTTVDALLSMDFVTLQSILETVFIEMVSITGWMQVSIGMLLVVASSVFILNTSGIILSVFMNKAFSSGGSPTVNWIRFSISKGYLTLKLFIFITLYRVSGIAGFEILQSFFPDNSMVNTNFFIMSNIPIGTIVIVAGVAYVAVYETNRFSKLVTDKWERSSKYTKGYIKRYDESMKKLNEALKSDNTGYKVAKMEDAIRDMEEDKRLLIMAEKELSNLASPDKIIRGLGLTCIGTILIQVIIGIFDSIGWGMILDVITGIFGP